jgi:aspartyl-tRNA(Asn)/glutamyl-tRNA(Gln) amidotransferase subunit B
MDYRYFPDADLPPIELTDEQIAKIRAEVEPTLPATLRTKLSELGVRQADAETLLLNDALSGLGYVQTVMAVGQADAKFTVNFLVNRLANAGDAGAGLPTATQFSAVSGMFRDGLLSSNNADLLLMELRGKADADAKTVAEQKGWIQETDTAAIEAIVDEVLADPASAKAVADIKAGNERVIGFLVGQVMKKSQGKANPAIVSQLIKQRLS